MELLSSLPAVIKALLRGKVTLAGALRPHKIPRRDLDGVRTIYDKVEGRGQRYELNLFISGQDEDEQPSAPPVVPAGEASES